MSRYLSMSCDFLFVFTLFYAYCRWKLYIMRTSLISGTVISASFLCINLHIGHNIFMHVMATSSLNCQGPKSKDTKYFGALLVIRGAFWWYQTTCVVWFPVSLLLSPIREDCMFSDISRAKVSRCQMWFWALPVIGAAHRWLHLNRKVWLPNGILWWPWTKIVMPL